MKRSVIGRFFDFLAFSNIFLAIAVTSLAFETEMVLNNPFNDLHYPFFLFCATLSLYCFHRLFRFDFRAASEKKSQRHQWLQTHQPLFYFLFFLAAGCTIYSILFFVPWRLLIPLLPIALVSVGYTVPCIPWNGKLLRLRDIPGIKIFLICIVLALTTVLIPVLGNADIRDFFHPEVLFVFFRRFFFIFAITLPFDVRDKAFDQEHHTKTIPLLLGDKQARRLAYLALIIFTGLAFLQFFWIHHMAFTYLLALLISAIISGCVIYLSGQQRGDFFYTYLLEGMMLVQCILILSANRLSL
jgi:4-hydroxybenzoate polyprenyltransferase